MCCSGKSGRRSASAFTNSVVWPDALGLHSLTYRIREIMFLPEMRHLKEIIWASSLAHCYLSVSSYSCFLNLCGFHIFFPGS